MDSDVYFRFNLFFRREKKMVIEKGIPNLDIFN